jgi:hypothetical protein
LKSKGARDLERGDRLRAYPRANAILEYLVPARCGLSDHAPSCIGNRIGLEEIRAMRVDGSCHCGQIKFEADIDPDRVRICHCADCQSLSGSAFRIVAPTDEASFRLLVGNPKLYIKRTSKSGAPRVQAFCSECGSSIYATSVGGEGRTFGVRVGSLQQREQLAPKRQFWCKSQLPWLPALPGEVFESQ